LGRQVLARYHYPDRQPAVAQGGSKLEAVYNGVILRHPPGTEVIQSELNDPAGARGLANVDVQSLRLNPIIVQECWTLNPIATSADLMA